MWRRWRDILPLLPLLLAAAVVPLVVRASFVPVSAETALLWTGEHINVDFFSHQKAWAVLICGAICLAVLLVRPRWRKDSRLAYGALAVYALCIIASTAFSAHARLALLGYPGRYEGGLVLLGYLLLCITAINHVETERRARWVVSAVAASALIIGIIGAAQFAGHDVFGTKFVQWLVVPLGPYSAQGHPTIHNRPFTIAATLYNSNYVGSYMAMLAPLCLGLYLFSNRRVGQWGWLGLSALLYFNLLGSQSRAGLLGGIVASAILMMAVARQAPRRLWRLAPAGGLLIAAVVAVNLALGGLVAREIAALWADPSSFLSPPPAVVTLNRVAVDGGRIRFETSQETLEIAHTDGKLSFSDGVRAQPVMPAADGQGMTFRRRRFQVYTVTVDPNNLLVLRRTGLPDFRFLWTAGGFQLLNARDEVVPANVPQESMVAGREVLGSGRLYIWKKSLPLLRQCKILGFGPDTFAAHFPQNDLVLKANVYGRIDIMIDKAHNGYLQVAITTGLVSLLAILALYAGYAWKSVRLIWRREAAGTRAAALSACLFSGLCGYALTFLFNDSVVSVAPVFWVLLGTGVAVNCQIVQSRAQLPRGAG